MSADLSSRTIMAHSRTASSAGNSQESGPFETIELTDAMSEPKATTAADNGEEMVTIAEGLEVVPSLLPNPELPHLKRALGWISLTSMGVGATIGAGIFVMTGIVAHDIAGPAISISFVVAAIACAFSGLCYVVNKSSWARCTADLAEFAALAPSAGSAYAYTRATMGQFLAFMLGWDLVLEYTVAGAAVAQSWSQYFNEFLGLFGTRIPAIISTPPFGFVTSTQRVTSSPGVLDLPALLISLLVMSLLVYGVRESARFNNVMVFIKVGVVLFVIIMGSFLVDTENWSPFAPFGWLGVSFFGKALPGQHRTAEGHGAGMLAGASLVFFSFLGFDSVSCQAEEARKPSRDLPVGILLSLAIATALYIGVSLVITGMVPYQEINIRAPLSSAFGQRGFHWAQYLIATGAVVGILSVLLVTMLSQPRIFMAMARDGLLPPFFASVHPRFKTPWKGTILTGVVVGVVSSTIPLTILVEFVSIGTLMAFTFVCISVLILRRTHPDLPRPFRCPLVPLVPVAGALLCILLMFSLPATNWYRLACWFGLGCVVYLLYGRKHGIGDRHRMYGQALTPPPPIPPTDGSTGSTPNSLQRQPSTLSDVMNMQQQKQPRNQSDSANVPVQVHGSNIIVVPPSFPTIGPPDADGSAAAAPTAQGSSALASPPLYNRSPTPTLPAPPGPRLERDRSERRLLWADEIGRELRLQAPPPPATFELTPTANPPAEEQASAALTEAPEPPPFDYHSLRVEAPETPQTRTSMRTDVDAYTLAPPASELHVQERSGSRGEDSDVHFEHSLDRQHPLDADAHAYGQEIEYRYSIDTSSSPR